MNKKFLKIFMFAFMCCIFFAQGIALANENSKVILIDAGHGGIDGGAVAKDGALEKDINLSISLLLRDKLNEKGYKVFMTREDDTGLYKEGQKVREKKREDLANRVKMKKSTDCDIFISIHQNMFSQDKYRGTQVWYASKGEESKNLATIVQNTFKEKVYTENNRVPKPAGNQFRVLHTNFKGASIIVECGFLSNPEEAKLLQTQDYQIKIAEALTESIDKYFE